MPDEMYRCLVCGYPDLDEPPYDEFGCSSFAICPCCGTEFGYDDAATSHEELRRRWVADGARWFSRATPPPPHWSAAEQLEQAGLLR
jgi:hypothetical protein